MYKENAMDRKKWSQLIKMLYNSHTQGVID